RSLRLLALGATTAQQSSSDSESASPTTYTTNSGSTFTTTDNQFAFLVAGLQSLHSSTSLPLIIATAPLSVLRAAAALPPCGLFQTTLASPT
ncbi:hypothetical protein J6590_077572, partial [Homalodisca vitripennis]